MALYPLKFEPWFLEKIWGGQKIRTVLGKKYTDGEAGLGKVRRFMIFALAGVPPARDKWLSSVVANGPLAGKTLHELVLEFGGSCMGMCRWLGRGGSFRS